jgi:two-component system sensor histidine kinase HydH
MLDRAFGQDATQLAAAEKRELLQRLLARLAHEIRNPLSSLDVHVQLLEEDLQGVENRAGDRLKARLAIIRGELGRLESVVEQFLRLGGPSRLELEPTDAAAILSHICGLMKPEAEARRVEIRVQMPEYLPNVPADFVQLTQALLNLLINALQAVESNGRVDIVAAQADGKLVLSIADSGPGLPPGKLTAVFDPYFTTKAEGSGLGLWISQQIITAHNGTLEAQNPPGGGALFVIRLPLCT